MSKLNHSDLVKIAQKWLRRDSVVVVTEMSIAYGEGEIPDAIGWDYGGWSTLIECKATRADFLGDKKKKCRQENSMGNKRYYLAPEGLIKTEELPKGWGLLEATDKRQRPRTVLFSSKKVNINQGREILLLISCLRRIGGLREGISVKCYQWDSKNRATLGILRDAEKENRDKNTYR